MTLWKQQNYGDGTNMSGSRSREVEWMKFLVGETILHIVKVDT